MTGNTDVLLTIFGTALCLGGWVIYWAGSRLIGVAFGLGTGFAFGFLLSLVLGLQGGGFNVVLLACSLLGAFGGVLVARAVSTFLFCLIGFIFGALLGRVGVQLYFHVQGIAYVLTTPVALVIVGCGAVVGVLTAWLQKYVMIVITSFVGATFLVAGVPALQHYALWAFAGTFLAAVLWQVVLVTQLLGDKPARRRA